MSSERKVMVSGLDPTWSASVAASDLNSNEDDTANGVSSLGEKINDLLNARNKNVLPY